MTTPNYEMQIASTVKPFIQSTDDVAYKFFVYFALFECAMKRSKIYLGGGENHPAKAAWDKLGEEWDKNFDSERTQEFKASVDYLTNRPPRKQVVKNNQLDWDSMSQGDPKKPGTYLIQIVRVVRNNLFHGGKYPSQRGPIAELSRDKELLHHCLIVLAECSQCVPDLQNYFIP